ncbi:HAD hydrolase family protein [Paenibacillus alkalitolerans]|uniref:HAD hydrolase family protein n=1 Tax=Paenibacillus alkalitolerans TaxID=2799335 RepID=UPI0018F50143|nr:HAD hydrolase family protein [Paenibacillus alkalitolerans]
MKRLIVDLDDTICTTKHGNYNESLPNQTVIEKLRHYKRDGFVIVICTSRNVRTYEGNVGKINANTLPVIISWLQSNQVPYDEIYVGKPWCGYDGFYIDDKAIRPSEFVSMDYHQIIELLQKEKNK